MFNTVIREEEVAKVEELVKVYKELQEVHTPNIPEDGEVSDLEFIHTTIFIDVLKDLSDNLSALHTLVTCTEEEFKERVVEKGGSIETVKKNIMLRTFMDMLGLDLD